MTRHIPAEYYYIHRWEEDTWTVCRNLKYAYILSILDICLPWRMYVCTSNNSYICMHMRFWSRARLSPIFITTTPERIALRIILKALSSPYSMIILQCFQSTWCFYTLYIKSTWPTYMLLHFFITVISWLAQCMGNIFGILHLYTIHWKWKKRVTFSCNEWKAGTTQNRTFPKDKNNTNFVLAWVRRSKGLRPTN